MGKLIFNIHFVSNVTEFSIDVERAQPPDTHKMYGPGLSTKFLTSVERAQTISPVANPTQVMLVATTTAAGWRTAKSQVIKTRAWTIPFGKFDCSYGFNSRMIPDPHTPR